MHIWIIGAVTLEVIVPFLSELLALLTAFLDRRRQQENHTVIAEYDTPNQLTPAELGYLIDGTFRHNELFATLAQLYAKRALQLKPTSIGVSVVPSDKEIDNLADVEAGLLGVLRQIAKPSVSLSQLDSALSTVAGTEYDLEDMTFQSLIDKGYLYKSVFGDMLFLKRLTSAVIATIMTLPVVVPLFLQVYQSKFDTTQGFESLDKEMYILVLLLISPLIWLACFAYANIIAYIYYRRAGVPVGATPRLRALWPDVAGFRLFLQETDFVRLQSVKDAKDPMMPYCLALGLDPGFVKILRNST